MNASVMSETANSSSLEDLVNKQQVVEYVRFLGDLLDNFRIGEFIDEFTEDGQYRLTPRDNYEAGNPVCLINDSKKRLRYRQEVIEKHWHFQKFRELRMLSPVSTSVTGNTATAMTNYAIYVTDYDGRTNIHLCGHFQDEFVKMDDRWRIKSRNAILDTYLPTYAIVLPP